MCLVAEVGADKELFLIINTGTESWYSGSGIARPKNWNGMGKAWKGMI
jgi:hypothetical protein